MGYIETGLYLPIRFYKEVSEQDRYKRHSVGVALTELNYPYVDCASLAPFQLVYDSAHDATQVQMNLICADTGEVTAIAYDAALWDDTVASDDLHHLSYLGTGSFNLWGNGKYYLQVRIIVPIGSAIVYYSDLFMIANCDDLYQVESFRLHTQSDNDAIRAIDVNDLRIFT